MTMTQPDQPYAKGTLFIPATENRLEVSERTVARILEAKKLVNEYQTIFDQLTNREKEVIPLVVRGLTSTQIAEKLRITRSTVDTHRKNVNRKLAIESPYQLVCIAQAFDLV
ncbi:helix-turn-helix domain-containing protein [Tunicatimonas pelagia]|uniref:helix-turn-helix domain-containing protein n=1 Tax=Tunicatimonas pelagia TaxID=931531 RepID=UPI002666B5C4|nr:helix-turn-helix transcriptional regulator [Tunicatimonas pelagia]WKN40671.1 helix-turn-helix transcriptional regulator [Tunicatimonas pelagia]